MSPPEAILRILQLSAQHDSEDDEPLRMFDPNVVEVRNIQGIIARRSVRVDDAFRLDHALQAATTTFRSSRLPASGGIREFHALTLSIATSTPIRLGLSARASVHLGR